MLYGYIVNHSLDDNTKGAWEEAGGPAASLSLLQAVQAWVKNAEPRA